MGIRVIALAPAAYSAWQRSMQLPASDDTSPGHAVFIRACSSCHTVRGTQAGGIFGPDLSHFALRNTLASGLLANTRENRVRWISDPQRIKPGARMPQIPLSTGDLDAVVDYLGTLK
jgi:cytochrome c oxidase subunit 2